ncbi:MAG: hypothetical protein U0934_21735 [Pseudotabrizicola sp.]|uniref:hypothetical protein n=1 Tax=Pseudotabrizicola sp. TaxID=2939647 RepID=UPI0027206A27|nr:hypothetical protein [Pseudotabrizicola sp.]MDO8884825.1 hypothetical protein [Pseudotabrizicola sp.]MDP2082151.1 hypothetical protein [Pseudotabrizicola sp.]MDZ7576544.1 hypothetical protein [Pseudotabrizicola sp.]
MIEKRLTKTRIRAGIWEGVLSGGDTLPALEVLLLETPLPGVSVEPVAGRAGEWAVRVPIPSAVLTDGVQTFLIREIGSTETLAHFTIITGVVLEDDLRAEVDLLRQELDMLKRAFRRHCLETMD